MITLAKRNSFDPIRHRVPEYDIYGMTKKDKLSYVSDYDNGVHSKTIRIPESWKGPNPGKTRTKLIEDHRSEFIPHPSYDIDGDGVVGGKDLVLAKIFDKDKDGILNEQEKKNAIQALSNGFEHNYLWGVETSGPNRSYRVLQKRGKICDADDFSQVLDTYPDNIKSNTHPFHKTTTELKAFRRKADKEKLENEKQEWDKKYPSSISRPYIPSEFFIEKPFHTSINQIKAELKREKREKAGLKPVGDFSVDEKPPPSLKYNVTPLALSKQQLIELRQNNNLTELKKMEAKQGTTEVGMDRLLRREECYFRQGNINLSLIHI